MADEERWEDVPLEDPPTRLVQVELAARVTFKYTVVVRVPLDATDRYVDQVVDRLYDDVASADYAEDRSSWTQSRDYCSGDRASSTGATPKFDAKVGDTGAVELVPVADESRVRMRLMQLSEAGVKLSSMPASVKLYSKKGTLRWLSCNPHFTSMFSDKAFVFADTLQAQRVVDEFPSVFEDGGYEVVALVRNTPLRNA